MAKKCPTCGSSRYIESKDYKKCKKCGYLNKSTNYINSKTPSFPMELS